MIESRINGGELSFECSIGIDKFIAYLGCDISTKVIVHDQINNKNTTCSIKINPDYAKLMPKNIYVTEKATTFEYSKDDKIILYRQKNDSMDLSYAFLYATFLKLSKLSKTQMHKFMDSLQDSVVAPKKKTKTSKK